MGIYDICFHCKCGSDHFAFARVQFLYSPDENISVGEFYANQDLPDSLRSFLTNGFVCENNPEIASLPDLDAFFFRLVGRSQHLDL
jgi:hypothetical protein